MSETSRHRMIHMGPKPPKPGGPYRSDSGHGGVHPQGHAEVEEENEEVRKKAKEQKKAGVKTDTGGVGSRGGNVIGRTSNGKPIYDNHNHVAHRGFTAKDHRDAVNTNLKMAAKKSGTELVGHLNAAQAHDSAQICK